MAVKNARKNIIKTSENNCYDKSERPDIVVGRLTNSPQNCPILGGLEVKRHYFRKNIMANKVPDQPKQVVLYVRASP